MGAENSLFTESESSSSPKRRVNTKQPDGKIHITHTHRVKLQHELHDISVYYNCSRPHGTFFLFQRASCWFVAIHDKKSEGNVRCSGFVSHSISIIIIIYLFSYNESENSTYIVWEKFGNTYMKKKNIYIYGDLSL